MGKMTKGASPVKGGGGSAPKGGMMPKQKTAVKPAGKVSKIAKGVPTKGSGADTNPCKRGR
jgi:hypothetical protein